MNLSGLKGCRVKNRLLKREGQIIGFDESSILVLYDEAEQPTKYLAKYLFKASFSQMFSLLMDMPALDKKAEKCSLPEILQKAETNWTLRKETGPAIRVVFSETGLSGEAEVLCDVLAKMAAKEKVELISRHHTALDFLMEDYALAHQMPLLVLPEANPEEVVENLQNGSRAAVLAAWKGKGRLPAVVELARDRGISCRVFLPSGRI